MNGEAGETAGGPVIRARNITREFRHATALDKVTLDVMVGEIFGLLGPDGSGKTTLMQIFAAILNPSGGQCHVLGFDTVKEDTAINSSVGYLSQGFTLYDRLSVIENLAFAARIRDVTESDLRLRADRLLDMAGLFEFQNRRAGNLSGGMRKKLSLCAALIHRPPLLLLDELSLGVDPLSRIELWEMLRTFRDEGVTIVITTPYMDEAGYCDRLGLLNRGKLVAIDEPRALRDLARAHTFELQTSSAIAGLNRIPGLLNVRRIENRIRFQAREPRDVERGLHEVLGDNGQVTPVEPTLEDAFVFLSQVDSAIDPHMEPAFEGLTHRASTSETERPTVEVRNLTCAFGKFIAVDNVSLTVEEGEILGFLGPNGAGKTTLIRALCGLLRPAAGDVSVADIDVRQNPRQVAQRIGYMSQRFSLYPDLTCLENLSFFGGAYGLRGPAKRDALDRASGLVRLQGALDRKVHDLSGAVRQRLALACSILHHPKVLFLDEPTSGVDPISRNRFWSLIQALAETGMTVFVTTHYLEEARHCDRVGLMARGRLLALGTIEHLREGIGAPADATMEDIFVQHVRSAIRSDEVSAV